MRLGDRMARLEKTLGRADANRPDIIIIRSVMEPGDDRPQSFAMVRRGPDGVVYVERDESETEVEFELRVRDAFNSDAATLASTAGQAPVTAASTVR